MKKKKGFFKKMNVVIILLALMMILGACGDTKEKLEQNDESPTAAVETVQDSETSTAAIETVQDNETSASAVGTALETDREGYEIEVPEEIKTIISLAPSTSEILIDLGLGNKIVGVDTNTKTMAILDGNLPAFDLQNPDAEQILALEPDVVFISGMSYFEGSDSLGFLKDNGICVISIPTSESIEAIKEDIRFIAAVTGRTGEGESVISSLEKEIAEIAAIGAIISARKTVYFEISPTPYLYSFGQNVFLQEMLEIIGADNIFADQEGWLSVNAEDVVAANPDVILSNVMFDGDPVPEILARDGFSEIAAVKYQNVYYIDNNASSIPSHNIVNALREMAAAVYPEYYLEIDLETE